MLTGQKKKFADALMKGINQRQSAIEAGYSEKTAKVKGSQLAKDKDVIAYMGRVSSPEQPENSISEKVETQVIKNRAKFDDPLEVMRRIMNDNIHDDPKLSLEAAAKLAPYVCPKVGEVGKKEAKNAAAKKAASKFRGISPPKLVVNNKD